MAHCVDVFVQECGEHGTCVDPVEARSDNNPQDFVPFVDPSSTGFLCRCDRGMSNLHSGCVVCSCFP